MIFIAMFIGMVIVGVFSLTLLAYSALMRGKPRIQHNKCHTDNMKIKDLHGHTEPHVWPSKQDGRKGLNSLELSGYPEKGSIGHS